MGSDKKRTRFHSKWRIDQDYLSRLSPADAAWLSKFNAEYYRLDFSGEPLHAAGAPRRELYQAQNFAARDLVTASSTEVTEALTRHISERPSIRCRFYAPEDHPFVRRAGAGDLEDGLIEVLDLEPRPAASQPSEPIDKTERCPRTKLRAS